jgi:hypothetical protein
MIAAGLIWLLGNSVNRPLREAGHGARQLHSFMFVPMEWWAYVILTLAVVAAIALGLR